MQYAGGDRSPDAHGKVSGLLGRAGDRGQRPYGRAGRDAQFEQELLTRRFEREVRIGEPSPPRRGLGGDQRGLSHELAHGLGALVGGHPLDERGHGDRAVDLRPVDLERARLKLGAGDGADVRKGAEAGDGGGDPGTGRGHRVEPERRLRDDAERAEGAGEQLAEVVPGDVLDDLAARPGDRAVGEHDRDADQQVARRAVPQAAWSGGRGGERAADGRPLDGDIEGELLARLAEGVGECLRRDPGLHAYDEVTGDVLQDLVQAAGVQQQVAALGRGAPVHLGAGAHREHGEIVLGRDPHHGGHLAGGLGQGDPAGRDPGDLVVRTGLPDRHTARREGVAGAHGRTLAARRRSMGGVERGSTAGPGREGGALLDREPGRGGRTLLDREPGRGGGTLLDREPGREERNAGRWRDGTGGVGRGIRTVPPLRRPPGDARPCAPRGPRRTTGAWGRSCRGWTGPWGRRRSARAAWCPDPPA